MGWFNNYQDSYDQYNNDGDHHAELSHELLAGAVSYEAAKTYENHCTDNGRPANHAEAKELFAGFAGAAADRLVEPAARNAYDRYRDNAVQQAQGNFDNQYSSYDYSQQQTNSCGNGCSQQTDYSQSSSYDQSSYGNY